MMRDAEKTVGNMIDKLKTAFIGSIDGEGFPTIKAMLQPRKRKVEIALFTVCVLYDTITEFLPYVAGSCG